MVLIEFMSKNTLHIHAQKNNNNNTLDWGKNQQFSQKLGKYDQK